MPTQIYETDIVETLDGEKIFITPLKIKYMKQFMKKFREIDSSSDDVESIGILAECCLIGMQQYYPEIKTIEQFEDKFDVKSIYKIIDIGAGIKMKKIDDTSDPLQNNDPKPQKEDGSWESLDLVALESEAFLLGIWKDYDELESSLCMQELSAILEAKREADYQDKKFMAAIQGVDLDEQSGRNAKGEDPWEAMKARVAAKVSGVENKGGNDITSYVGVKAKQKGFGIGMGLSYEKVTE
jgi:hypothetical protein